MGTGFLNYVSENSGTHIDLELFVGLMSDSVKIYDSEMKVSDHATDYFSRLKSWFGVDDDFDLNCYRDAN